MVKSIDDYSLTFHINAPLPHLIDIKQVEQSSMFCCFTFVHVHDHVVMCTLLHVCVLRRFNFHGSSIHHKKSQKLGPSIIPHYTVVDHSLRSLIPST